MQLAVIADAYPPMKTSGAVLIRDLVAELCKQGHEVTVLLPDSTLDSDWKLERNVSLDVLRLRAMPTKDVSYFRRAIAEHLLSRFMYSNLMRSPLKKKCWEGIIWYSPSIFFGELVGKMKSSSSCPAYLVLRDIFPDWALDMGLLQQGLIYRYFKKKEKQQYLQADVIGVQTASNLKYFRTEHSDLHARVEVLNNWMASAPAADCRIELDKTLLTGRRIFVYTGNIGIAQGMDILVELADACRHDAKVGFLIVGRGTAVKKIRTMAAERKLDNILFHDEIPPEEIPGLLSQCHVGLVALDPRHRNDNIPGKFLSYMQAGLPVLATINPGNDLEVMIRENRVGEVVSDNNLATLLAGAINILEKLLTDRDMPGRCRRLAEQAFSPESAVKKITGAFSQIG